MTTPREGGRGPDAGADVRTRTVLLVDDDAVLREVLSGYVTHLGYVVTRAGNGESALELVRAQHFDGLVIDVRLPDIRGDVVFEIARAYQPHLTDSAILITGDTSQITQRVVQQAQIPVLRKPFGLHVLEELLAARVGPRGPSLDGIRPAR